MAQKGQQVVYPRTFYTDLNGLLCKVIKGTTLHSQPLLEMGHRDLPNRVGVGPVWTDHHAKRSKRGMCKAARFHRGLDDGGAAFSTRQATLAIADPLQAADRQGLAAVHLVVPDPEVTQPPALGLALPL
jgi:hypothetical protein